MKNKGRFAVATLTAGLIGLRLFAPEFGAQLRARLRSVCEQDPAYIAVFSGKSVQMTERPVETPALREPQRPEKMLVAVGRTAVQTQAGEQPELCIPPAVQEAVPADEAEAEALPAETAEPIPAAVQAFLESQEAFSDYALPAQVDYTYTPLPFEYSIPVAGYNSSGFGYRLHPILETVRFHYGTDFAAWTGEQVMAFADGTVTYAGYDDSYGWHVQIDHGDGWSSLYAHCNELRVSWGQQVQSGECIALVGESGLATGPHLHFELKHNGMYLNPEYYINS